MFRLKTFTVFFFNVIPNHDQVKLSIRVAYICLPSNNIFVKCLHNKCIVFKTRGRTEPRGRSYKYLRLVMENRDFQTFSRKIRVRREHF